MKNTQGLNPITESYRVVAGIASTLGRESVAHRWGKNPNLTLQKQTLRYNRQATYHFVLPVQSVLKEDLRTELATNGVIKSTAAPHISFTVELDEIRAMKPTAYERLEYDVLSDGNKAAIIQGSQKSIIDSLKKTIDIQFFHAVVEKGKTGITESGTVKAQSDIREISTLYALPDTTKDELEFKSRKIYSFFDEVIEDNTHFLDGTKIITYSREQFKVIMRRSLRRNLINNYLYTSKEKTISEYYGMSKSKGDKGAGGVDFNYLGTDIYVAEDDMLPAGVEAVVMMTGAFKPIFSFLSEFGYDKIPGISVWVMSYDFMLGTAPIQPQLATIITTDTTAYPEQDKIGMGQWSYTPTIFSASTGKFPATSTRKEVKKEVKTINIGDEKPTLGF